MTTSTFREKICSDLFLSESQVNRLISRAPHTYKIYQIAKRSGGTRTIAQPAKETKLLQNWIIKNIFSKLPVHDCATAYRKGASIRNNAIQHSKNRYLAKFDFESFFSSIKFNDIVSHLNKHFGGAWALNDMRDIARVSCIQYQAGYAHCLSVGAPSSPILSNSVMYDFDVKVSDWCVKHKVVYTRYADDLTFSTNIRDLSKEIEPLLRRLIAEIEYPLLKINENKTILLSKKTQRRITGLVISNEGKVSLGRDKKREIRALIHKYSCGKISEENVFKLQGLLGFATDCEPLFVSRMRSKYGSQVISDILQKRKSCEDEEVL